MMIDSIILSPGGRKRLRALSERQQKAQGPSPIDGVGYSLNAMCISQKIEKLKHFSRRGGVLGSGTSLLPTCKILAKTNLNLNDHFNDTFYHVKDIVSNSVLST